MADPAVYTRGRLERIAEDALRRAGVLGTVPTPLDAVAAAAGIRAEPIGALAGAPAEPPLLGALWFEERTMFVERRQSAVRRRFTEAHELMHALCPWHEAALRTDTAADLFGPARDAIEAEANAGAGMLIFGGSRFTARAADGALSLRTALALAAEHGASVHATLHHYVETHRAEAALLVAGRFPRRDGSLPVWRTVRSRRFTAALPGELAAGSPLHALAERARTADEPPSAAIRLHDRDWIAEAHDNRHAFFLFVAALKG